MAKTVPVPVPVPVPVYPTLRLRGQARVWPLRSQSCSHHPLRPGALMRLDGLGQRRRRRAVVSANVILGCQAGYTGGGCAGETMAVAADHAPGRLRKRDGLVGLGSSALAVQGPRGARTPRRAESGERDAVTNGDQCGH
ncbi:hypothetical protein AcW1_006262 [Taiwanofungus camphoratus]|nr:hypothetical protein AcW1_006262 [Antrodia cinnamomea]